MLISDLLQVAVDLFRGNISCYKLERRMVMTVPVGTAWRTEGYLEHTWDRSHITNFLLQLLSLSLPPTPPPPPPLLLLLLLLQRSSVWRCNIVFEHLRIYFSVLIRGELIDVSCGLPQSFQKYFGIIFHVKLLPLPRTSFAPYCLL